MAKENTYQGDFIMNKSLIVNKSHELIKNTTNKDIAIDATVGNGHDTLLLASLFNHVYSFDIQPLAIKRTSEKIKDYSNVTLINDDFNNIRNHVSELVDLIIFNLGYLPGSNKKVLTSDYNSENAIINAYSLLKDDGTLIICCYLGHEGGKEEFKRVTNSLCNNNIMFNKESFNEDKEVLLLIKKRLVS